MQANIALLNQSNNQFVQLTQNLSDNQSLLLDPNWKANMAVVLFAWEPDARHI